jgi:hypothetical protein
MASFGLLDQGAEEGELFGVAAGHSFGVPLDSEEEAAWTLNRLDDPIRSSGADNEVRRQVSDDLVVRAGDGHVPRAQNVGEARTRRDRNPVSWLAAPFTRAHVRRVGPLAIGEVLVEGAAQRHVQHLEASADP